MGFTLVTFHAHPDDEAIATGGTMAHAKAEGHRVVLVLATRGELGEYAPDALGDGETLTDRRVAEVDERGRDPRRRPRRVPRISRLGHGGRGRRTTTITRLPRPTSTRPRPRLAQLLIAEQADVLTIYDDHGGYGHPDHVQVHRVGIRAAELVPDAARRRVDDEPRPHPAADGGAGRRDAATPRTRPIPTTMKDFGSPESIITTTVDVRDYVDQKRAAMAAHASQIPADSFFLQMPPDAFRVAFG